MPKGNAQRHTQNTFSHLDLSDCDNEFQVLKIFKNLNSKFMHLNTDEWLMVSIQKTLPKAEFAVPHILCVSVGN